MKRSRRGEEEKEEDGLGRNREKRGRRHLEEEEMMRGKRSRREQEEGGRLSRSSPEMGPVERWRSSRREKERDSEFSGSEDDSTRPRVRKGDFVRMEKEERGGFERVGERKPIREDEDGRERFRNILTEIFLALSGNIFLSFCFLSQLSTFAGMRLWTRDWREWRERRMKRRSNYYLHFLSSLSRL